MQLPWPLHPVLPSRARQAPIRGPSFPAGQSLLLVLMWPELAPQAGIQGLALVWRKREDQGVESRAGLWLPLAENGCTCAAHLGVHVWPAALHILGSVYPTGLRRGPGQGSVLPPTGPFRTRFDTQVDRAGVPCAPCASKRPSQ